MENKNETVQYNVNLNLRLSKELRDKLQRVARKNNIKASEIIRECIRRLEE